MTPNENVLRTIRKAGWLENTKRCNENEIAELIKNADFTPFPKVVSFLSEFEGLKIYFKNKKNGLENDDISFDIRHAIDLEVPERLRRDYSPRIGKELCIIGSAFRDYFILMMSPDGNIYGGYDDFLCMIGNSGLEAIENIILGKDFLVIPVNE